MPTASKRQRIISDDEEDDEGTPVKPPPKKRKRGHGIAQVLKSGPTRRRRAKKNRVTATTTSDTVSAKLTKLKEAARYIARFVYPLINFDDVFTQALEDHDEDEDGREPEDAFQAFERDSNAKAYKAIMDRYPELDIEDFRILDDDPDEVKEEKDNVRALLIRLLTEELSAARSTDGSSVKANIISLLRQDLPTMPPPLIDDDDAYHEFTTNERQDHRDACTEASQYTDFFLPIDISNKNNCGYHSRVTGRLLTPVSQLDEYSENPDRFLASIEGQEFPLRAGDLPAFLCPLYRADQTRADLGFFRSHLMIRTTKLLYVGSTAAKAQGIEYKKGLAKPGQAAAHGVKQVTPRMIAYIALQIRQTLSSSDDWRKEDGHVAKAHFYRKVLAHFQPRLAANDPDDAEEDDRWGHRETAAAPLSEEEQALIDAQTCADNAKLYVWYERLVFGGSAEMTAPKGPAVARPISTADVIQQRRLQQLRRQQQAQPQDDERRRTPAPTSPPHSASASSPDRDPRLLFWQSPVSPHRSPRTPRNSSVSPASPRPIVDLRRPAASPLSSMPPQQSSRTLIDTGSLEPDHRLPRRPEALSAISSSSCHVENQAPGDGATVLSPHPPHRSSETVEPASPTAKGKGKGKGKGKATMKEVPSRIQPRRAKK